LKTMLLSVQLMPRVPRSMTRFSAPAAMCTKFSWRYYAFTVWCMPSKMANGLRVTPPISSKCCVMSTSCQAIPR
jgi:hypothetical protein